MHRHDIIFRIGDYPDQIARADFLTGGSINCSTGYHAVMGGHLSAEQLARNAAWHHDLNPVLRCFDPDFTSDIEKCHEGLLRYDLLHNPHRSTRSIRQEKEAREQLALDLALSADIFSSQGFAKSCDEDLGLENITKRLSLAGEPPLIDYGYLRPFPSVDHYNRTEKEEVGEPNGIHNLLKGWEIGADPDSLVFVEHDGRNILTRPSQQTQDFGEAHKINQTQRPPMVRAATINILPKEPDRALKAQSQGLNLPPNILGEMPPEYGMSTQVLPGAYGGRPSAGKKKVGKKRLGGF